MSQDYLKITLSEDSKTVLLSRIIDEGGEEKQLFLQPIPREQFRVEITEENAIIWREAEGNTRALIGGRITQETSIDALNFAPHETIGAKKNALIGLPIYYRAGSDGAGSDGAGGGSGVEVGALGVEYKTGRIISGKEEHAINFEFNGVNQDVAAGASYIVDYFNMPLADQYTLKIKATDFQNFNTLFEKSPFTLSISQSNGEVNLNNLTSAPLAIVEGAKYRYTVTYLKP